MSDGRGSNFNFAEHLYINPNATEIETQITKLEHGSKF